MASDLSIPVEVVPCPTPADGLAMSSRNVYLRGRAQAVVLRRALDAGLARLVAGETDPSAVEAAMAEVVAEAPLGTLDYAAGVQADTPVTMAPSWGQVRLLLAVRSVSPSHRQRRHRRDARALSRPHHRTEALRHSWLHRFGFNAVTSISIRTRAGEAGDFHGGGWPGVAKVVTECRPAWLEVGTVGQQVSHANDVGGAPASVSAVSMLVRVCSV